LFTVRRIANSWLDGASAGPVDGLVTGSSGIVSAEAAEGPTRQTNSTAATTLRRGHFSDIRASARQVTAFSGYRQSFGTRNFVPFPAKKW
jgi:hypothetical protein